MITSKTAAFLLVAFSFLLYLVVGSTNYAYLIPACTVMMCIIYVLVNEYMGARIQRAPEARDAPQAVEIAPQENNIEKIAAAVEVNENPGIAALLEQNRRDVEMLQYNPRIPLERKE